MTALYIMITESVHLFFLIMFYYSISVCFCIRSIKDDTSIQWNIQWKNH